MVGKERGYQGKKLTLYAYTPLSGQKIMMNNPQRNMYTQRLVELRRELIFKRDS
jgi:hypothetical protein